jgi:hypothetical protein
MGVNGSHRDLSQKLSQNLNRLENAPHRENICFTTPHGGNHNTNTLVSQIVSQTAQIPKLNRRSSNESNKMIEEHIDCPAGGNENFNAGPVGLPNFVGEKEKASAEKKPNSDSKVYLDLKRKCPDDSEGTIREDVNPERAGSRSTKDYSKKILTNSDGAHRIQEIHNAPQIGLKKFDELSLGDATLKNDSKNNSQNASKSVVLKNLDPNSRKPTISFLQKQSKAMSTTSNTLDRKPETKTRTQSKKNPGFDVCVVCLSKDSNKGRLTSLACAHKIHEVIFLRLTKIEL